jgi:hypothetical protein
VVLGDSTYIIMPSTAQPSIKPPSTASVITAQVTMLA